MDFSEDKADQLALYRGLLDAMRQKASPFPMPPARADTTTIAGRDIVSNWIADNARRSIGFGPKVIPSQEPGSGPEATGYGMGDAFLIGAGKGYSDFGQAVVNGKTYAQMLAAAVAGNPNWMAELRRRHAARLQEQANNEGLLRPLQVKYPEAMSAGASIPGLLMPWQP